MNVVPTATTEARPLVSSCRPFQQLATRKSRCTRVSHPRDGAHELVTHSGAIQLLDTF